jgi:hypothetical protein
MVLLASCLACLGVPGLPASANAEGWPLCLVEQTLQGASADTARTLVRLLVREVDRRGRQLRVLEPTDGRGDCAQAVSLHAGLRGDRVLMELAWEGVSHIWVSAEAGNLGSLEVAAASLAAALVEKTRQAVPPRTGALAGTRTHGGLLHGMVLRLGAQIPASDAFHSASPGPVVDGGWWADGRNIGLDARIGTRWGAARQDSAGRLRMLTMDVGAYWLPRATGVSPLLGAGMGLRQVSAREVLEVATETEPRETRMDRAWGGAGWVRLGLLAVRQSPVRVSVFADLEANLVPMRNRRAHTVTLFGAALHL